MFYGPKRFSFTFGFEIWDMNRVAQERCSTVRHERQWSVEGFDTEELDRLHEQLPGVGYQVRFDRKIPENAGVMFCTTGILLRWLLSDPDLEVSSSPLSTSLLCSENKNKKRFSLSGI